MTHTREYRVLPGVVRYTCIIFGIFYEAKPVPPACPRHKIPGTPLIEYTVSVCQDEIVQDIGQIRKTYCSMDRRM